MSEAISQAKLAFSQSEVPVGCVIVKDKEIISRAYNLIEKNKLVTNHAEIIAIEQASNYLNNKYLYDCDLFVTLEPCSMCAGAIIHSKIKRLYFGAFDLKSGAAGSRVNLFEENKFNHNVEVYGGIKEEESKELLKIFFNKLR
jgi:tRNA(adenine34) deaminase